MGSAELFIEYVVYVYIRVQFSYVQKTVKHEPIRLGPARLGQISASHFRHMQLYLVAIVFT